MTLKLKEIAGSRWACLVLLSAHIQASGTLKRKGSDSKEASECRSHNPHLTSSIIGLSNYRSVVPSYLHKS